VAEDKTAIHESGHCWAGLRAGWSVHAATVNGGALSSGCSLITAAESGTALAAHAAAIGSPWYSRASRTGP
jgi:hypothetical protein